MREEIDFFEPEASCYLDCPKKNGRFVNPHIKNIRRSVWDFLMWQSGKYEKERFHPEPPKGFSYPNPQKPIDLSSPIVSWINHSTFHLRYAGIEILTDPIWSTRCSPVKFMGPKRLHQPPTQLNDLSNVKIVLISHDHYDHLDEDSIRKLVKVCPKVIFFVPEGVKKWFLKRGFDRVIELSWWGKESLQLDEDLRITVTSVPSQHFSGRSLLGTNKTLWCGWVVQFFEKDIMRRQCYFVGDTGYNPVDFDLIGRTFGGFDLSLIPIGTYIPYTFMAPVHICPVKAVSIHKEVNSKLSVGMHWKTFKLSDEGIDQPPYDLYLAMKEENLDPLSFRVLAPGQQINW